MRFCSLNTCRWMRVQGSVFHPYIDRVIVFIACPLRLVPLPSTVPGLCQHILWLSQRRWLLRPSHTGLAYGGHLLPGSHGGLRGRRARAALLRSWKLFGVVCRAALFAGVLRDAFWITSLGVQPFSMPLLGQANNPRRLVVPHDDSGVRSCSYPCTTLLGGMGWWIQHDRLSRPLHSVEGQSQPWGVGIILASGREELHLYSFQVIKDRAVSTPHPWLQRHFEGTDHRNSLNAAQNVWTRSVSRSEAWSDFF